MKRKHQNLEENATSLHGDAPERAPPSRCSPAPERRCRRSDTNTSSLTQESLRALDSQTEPLYGHFELELWRDSVQSMSPPEESEPIPPRPSIAPSSYTSTTPRSRSSSPGKKWPRDISYRLQNLNRADIFVDSDDDSVPATTRIIIGNIKNSAQAILRQAPLDGDIGRRASQWCKTSKELAAKAAGEADWQEALMEVMKGALLAHTGDLGSMQNRDWLSEVKPPVRQPPPPRSSIPRKRPGRTEPQETLPTPAASFQSTETTEQITAIQTAEQITTPVLVQAPHFPVPKNPTPAPAQPVNAFELKTPRPDAFIAFSTQALITALRPIPRLFLNDLQSNGELLSDPVYQGSGLCFPFLIVEAKSGATGGNLFQAQNQAAVSGASAIDILKSLENLYAESGSSGSPTHKAARQHHTLQQHQDQPEHEGTREDLPFLVFSAVTEGPMHELWAHFWNAQESSYGMTCIGVWRTTNANSSRELLCTVAAILLWGVDEQKPRIIERIRAVARCHEQEG